MRSWFRRHSLLLLWLIVIAGGIGGFRRAEAIASTARHVASQNKHLTQALEATVAERRHEICAAEIQTRTAVRTLLLGVVDDFLAPNRKAVLELRIREALDTTPEGC